MEVSDDDYATFMTQNVTVDDPPTPCFTVTRTAALTFRANATCAGDDFTPAGNLSVRWDWQDDGVWDTNYSTNRTATFTYPAEAAYTIRLEALDSLSQANATTRGVALKTTSGVTSCFVLNGTRGDVGAKFFVDATCIDVEGAPITLANFRWDWNNDGTWDTTYSTSRVANTTYNATSAPTIKVEAKVGNTKAQTTHNLTVGPALVEIVLEGDSGKEPDVAVNPTNRTNVLATTRNGGENFGNGTVAYPLFYSRDNGTSWLQSNGTSGIGRFDPQVEFDANGTAYYLALVDRGGNYAGGVNIAKSTNGGQNFTLLADPVDYNTTFVLENGTPAKVVPSWAAWDYGKLGVDKGTASPYKNSLYFVGSGFGSGYTPVCPCSPTPAASWGSGFAYSRDGGATWSGQKVLSNMTWANTIAIAPNGTLYIPGIVGGACGAYNALVVRRSTDGGGNFSATMCALAFTDSFNISWERTGSHPSVAVDPTNSSKLWMVFEATDVAGSNTTHVYVIRSTDSGATWSAPVRVDDVLSPDTAGVSTASVAMSSTGRLDVSWITARNSITWGSSQDAYYSYSTDGGLTWAKNLRLSRFTRQSYQQPGNDYATITSDGTRAYAVYGMRADDGDHRTHVARVTHGP